MYDQSEDYSSKDSFCLQMKVQLQGDEAETKFTALQHLVTNLEIKVKASQEGNQIFNGKNRHLCQCECYTSQHA